MDFLKKAADAYQSSQGQDKQHQQQSQEHHSGKDDNQVSGLLGNIMGNKQAEQTDHKSDKQSGGLMGFVNNAMGGGASGEAKEDGLDKAIDTFQERFMGAGPQNNESAIEQAKDEQIAKTIREQWKQHTGKDMPNVPKFS